MDHRRIDKRYLDTRRPLAARVGLLVSQMTLREKIAQMLHRAPPIPRLQVPAYNWWNECLHGVGRAGRATVFPQAIGLAATFNVPLVGRIATAISDEARAKHHQALRQGNLGQYFGLTFWTPNINIFRDPRWGRGQETYGECPHLTARMGVVFTKGLQGHDPKYLKLVATPKHFAVHSGPESTRHSFDAVVGQRDLRETYLPAFEACVREGRAFSVMGAYNRTNGEPCCGSRTLLQKILRQEWGFEGYVVSDCWAIQDFHLGHKVTQTPQESVALAVRNGCDLNCGNIYPRLLEAVQEGLVTEAEITRSVTRLFTARFRLGMFDPEKKVPWSKLSPKIVNCAAHQKLARQAARESVVLLKNEGGLLPLSKELKHVGVIGPNAASLKVLLGNYNGFAPQLSTVLEGLVGAVSSATQVNYAEGCDLTGDRPLHRGYEVNDVLQDVDVIIAVLGNTPDLEGEEGSAQVSGDRTGMELPGRQLELLQKIQATGKPVVLVLTGGSPIELQWAAANVPAIVMAWYPGEQGGAAVAEVLFGDYNPAGRLPVTFPKSLDQVPAFTEYAMAGRTYRFMAEAPLYRFGYGLSYTKFAYSKLTLSKNKIAAGASITVSADVKNVGRCDGDEVVQLYVKDVAASVPVPLVHLEGCRRVALRAGQKKTVTFKLLPAALAAYADDGTAFIEPGEFRVSVGGGQPDDPASGAVSATLRVNE
jgi:beta-glucosidase